MNEDLYPCGVQFSDKGGISTTVHSVRASGDYLEPTT
jgi:hypothetical protein